MDKILIIVCAVVGSLGVLSAIFGFSAEGTKLTVSNTDRSARFLRFCKDAYGLALLFCDTTGLAFACLTEV